MPEHSPFDDLFDQFVPHPVSNINDRLIRIIRRFLHIKEKGCGIKDRTPDVIHFTAITFVF